MLNRYSKTACPKYIHFQVSRTQLHRYVSTFISLTITISAKVTSDNNGEANPDFDNSGAPESFFVRNKKTFDK